MKKVAKLMALVMATGCVMGMAACEQEKTLKIGYTIYAPMNYTDETTGEFVGFDTEFALKVCEDLGYKAEFVEIVWDTKVASLESKEIDCIWNGMTITDELKSEILISDAYMENKQVVVVRAEDKNAYAAVEDLVNAESIAVEEGSAAETLVTEIDGMSADKVKGFGSQRDTLLEVKTSASDVAVIDYTMAKSMTGAGSSYAELSYCEVGFPVEEYGIGFRKDDTELCNKVNELIEKYKTDGTFDELIAKYMV